MHTYLPVCKTEPNTFLGVVGFSGKTEHATDKVHFAQTRLKDASLHTLVTWKDGD